MGVDVSKILFDCRTDGMETITSPSIQSPISNPREIPAGIYAPVTVGIAPGTIVLSAIQAQTKAETEVFALLEAKYLRGAPSTEVSKLRDSALCAAALNVNADVPDDERASHASRALILLRQAQGTAQGHAEAIEKFLWNLIKDLQKKVRELENREPGTLAEEEKNETKALIRMAVKLANRNQEAWDRAFTANSSELEPYSNVQECHDHLTGANYIKAYVNKFAEAINLSIQKLSTPRTAQNP